MEYDKCVYDCPSGKLCAERGIKYKSKQCLELEAPEESTPFVPPNSLVEPGVVGIVSCNVNVNCPHCENSLDLSQDPYGDDEWSELGGYIFGFVNKPAKWTGLQMEYECSHCHKVFILKGLEY